VSISDIKTFIKQLVLLVSLYELLMSFRSPRKRPPSIVLPWGRVRERILVSDHPLLFYHGIAYENVFL